MKCGAGGQEMEYHCLTKVWFIAFLRVREEGELGDT